MKFIAVMCVVSATMACSGSKSPTAATTAPPPAPTPTTFTLSGTVTSTSGTPINGATVRVNDGPNASRSATTAANGTYTLANLTLSGFTATASATNFVALGKGVNLTSSQTIDFQLTPTPLFTANGTGNTVFDMPTTVARVRIIGTYTGNSSNFIVRIGSSLVVNDIIGTSQTFGGRTVSDGTYLTTGGVVSITNSAGVVWSFTEVRTQ
jgi:hypothetical protein